MFDESIRSLVMEVDTDTREKIVMPMTSSGKIRPSQLGDETATDLNNLQVRLTEALRDKPLITLRPQIREIASRRATGRIHQPALARIWKNAIAEIDGVRLGIDIETPLSKALPSLRRLSYELKGQSPSSTLWTLSPAEISSIVVTRNLQCEQRWGWPLRIGFLSIAEDAAAALRIRSISMVRRNLATVTILGGDETECDLLISSAPMPEILMRLLSLRLEIKVGAVASLTGKPASMRNFGSNIDALHHILRAGAFASNVVPIDRVADWTNALVRSLSHNLPFDVALWNAHAAASESGRLNPPPMLIADPEFLTRTKLEYTIMNLADRIDTLHHVEAIPVSLDTANRLGVSQGKQPTKELARALSDNAQMIAFDQESDGATGIAQLEQIVAANEYVEAILETQTAKPPPVRKLYADLTIFDQTGAKRIDDTIEPLVKNRNYQLEVALRRIRTGVSYRGDSPKYVAPPPVNVEVELFVVISVREGDFNVLEPVQPIVLPEKVDKDSKLNAIFEITPLRRTTDSDNLAEIEVRIYYEFNLIEQLVLKAEVLERTKGNLYSHLGLSAPIFVEQFSRIGRSYADLKQGLRPRQMSIDVRRAGDLYRFNFAFRANSSKASDDKDRRVLMHARSEISPADLTRELNRIRNVWLSIAMERYATGVEGCQRVFLESLRELARAGRDLWSLLFRGKQDSAIWHIGEWLKKHPPVEGAVIEVRLLEGTTSFVFPWSLLFDQRVPRARSDLPDPKGFWGLRYSIEQKPANGPFVSDNPIATTEEGLQLAFMIWESFQNAGDQNKLLSQLAKTSNGRLTVTVPPVNDPDQFYELVENCEADILYFYTHGNTRPVEADRGYSELKRVRQRYEKLPDTAPGKAALKDLYNFITEPDFEPDESWIALTWGRLFLRDLRAETVRLNRNPIVILNMCQSAQILPGISESFVSFFLDRKARSVIGTECPITNEFAHPFSRQLFNELLKGLPIGEALRRTRRYFIKKRNPLALAYTLFGSATTQYDPAILPSESGPRPTARVERRGGI